MNIYVVSAYELFILTCFITSKFLAHLWFFSSAFEICHIKYVHNFSFYKNQLRMSIQIDSTCLDF